MKTLLKLRNLILNTFLSVMLTTVIGSCDRINSSSEADSEVKDNTESTSAEDMTTDTSGESTEDDREENDSSEVSSEETEKEE